MTMEGDVQEDDVYLDAEDIENFEEAPSNTEVNFEEMAENYFSRVDENPPTVRKGRGCGT